MCDGVSGSKATWKCGCMPEEGADVEQEIIDKKKNVTEQMETMNMLKPKNTRDIDNARDIIM